MNLMYRSFEPQSWQRQGEGEGAYSKGYVTETSTPRMPALRSNPSGGDSFAASLCCALGHPSTALRVNFGLYYAPSGAPRSAAKLFAAIGAADSSEAP